MQDLTIRLGRGWFPDLDIPTDPLAIDWEPITSPEDRKALIREAFADLAGTAATLADLAPDEYVRRARELVDQWNTVYANVVQSSLPGRPRKSDAAKRAILFCRHKIGGESKAKLGRELVGNPENGADGRDTIRNWFKHIEELLSLA